jgi:Flp pilus assembly protein TadB
MHAMQPCSCGCAAAGVVVRGGGGKKAGWPLHPWYDGYSEPSRLNRARGGMGVLVRRRPSQQQHTRQQEGDEQQKSDDDGRPPRLQPESAKADGDRRSGYTWLALLLGWGLWFAVLAWVLRELATEVSKQGGVHQIWLKRTTSRRTKQLHVELPPPEYGGGGS